MLKCVKNSKSQKTIPEIPLSIPQIVESHKKTIQEPDDKATMQCNLQSGIMQTNFETNVHRKLK